MRYLCIGIFCLFLIACNDSPTYAPVTEVNTIDAIPRAGKHDVSRGETLYEIAWRYGLDYRYLAARNRLHAPYDISEGQIIYLKGKTSATRLPVPVSASLSAPPIPQHVPLASASSLKERTTDEPNVTVLAWHWPAQGTVVTTFSAINKGINIVGRVGEPIYASATGKVVYCSDGLRGYGNLIILKHNNLYLSAYAHNQRVFVKEGDWVKQGQKIAEMGDTGADKVMLHFEIRKAGKPINPMTVLIGRNSPKS